MGFLIKSPLRERLKSQGVVINGYHNYNWVLQKSDFIEEMLKYQQTIKLSGDGALHKNGKSKWKC